MLELGEVGQFLSLILDLVLESLSLRDYLLVALTKIQVFVLSLFDLLFELLLKAGGIAHLAVGLSYLVNEKRCLELLEFLVILVELTRLAGLLFERSLALFKFA